MLKNNKAFLSALACKKMLVALVLLTIPSWFETAGCENTPVEKDDFTYETLGCMVCHGIEGQGVPLPNYAKKKIPDLNKLAEVMWLRHKEDIEKIAGYLKKGVRLETLRDHPPVPRFNVVLAKYDIVKKVIREGRQAAKLDPDGRKPPVDMPSFGWILTDEKIDDMIAHFLSRYNFEEDEEEIEQEPSKQTTTTVAVTYLREDIDLSRGISPQTWRSLEPATIDLMYQFITLPAAKKRIPAVIVKSFHNRRDIYFYLSWKDDTENRSFALNKFSDACAIMFPMKRDANPITLLMGVTGKSNIWQWKAGRDRQFWLKPELANEVTADFYYPFEDKEVLPVSRDTLRSAVDDLLAEGAGTLTRKDTGNIQGRGLWVDGTWHVVFKRSLESDGPMFDATFDPGDQRLLAFALWNGQNGDRGGRKSFSSLVELDIE
jgi:hypothetical protein